MHFDNLEQWPRIIINMPAEKQKAFIKKQTELLANAGRKSVNLNALSMLEEITLIKENFSQYLREGWDFFDTSYALHYIEQKIMSELVPDQEQGGKAKELKNN